MPESKPQVRTDFMVANKNRSGNTKDIMLAVVLSLTVSGLYALPLYQEEYSVNKLTKTLVANGSTAKIDNAIEGMTISTKGVQRSINEAKVQIDSIKQEKSEALARQNDSPLQTLSQKRHRLYKNVVNFAIAIGSLIATFYIFLIFARGRHRGY